MKLSYAYQYHKPSIVIDPGDTADDIVRVATREGALYEEAPGDWCFVVEFPGRTPELYTETALRGSLNSPNFRKGIKDEETTDQ